MSKIKKNFRSNISNGKRKIIPKIFTNNSRTEFFLCFSLDRIFLCLSLGKEGIIVEKL